MKFHFRDELTLGALGFEWMPSQSNIIHINRWKLESDIIPSSPARKKKLFSWLSHEEARACYPQRWKVHPSMKIMRFRWGMLKMTSGIPPPHPFGNKQLDVVISIIMLFTSQRKRKAKCACTNSWEWKVSVFLDSDKAMAWRGSTVGCALFAQAAAFCCWSCYIKIQNGEV